MGWRRFVKRSWWDEERKREIEAHLEIEASENIARGMTPADARAAAQRRFGNALRVREEIYRMNTINWLESTWQDARFGARLLRLSPGFTAVAILSLALGIGGNTAIFQLLDAVRLRSLPIQNPHELVEVRIPGGNGGMGINPGAYGRLTRPVWQEIHDRQQAFSGVFAWSAGDARVGEPSNLKRVRALRVSGDFFSVLGVQPLRGRLFLPEDEAACPTTRAVVSDAYWRHQMGGRDLAADSKLLVNGELHEVIGVTPPGFFGLAVGESFDVALPFCQPKELRRDVFDVSVMGRLRSDWTLERASAHFDTLSPGIFAATEITGYSSEAIQKYRKFRLAAYPASGGVSELRDSYDTSLRLLLAITGLVLLIACANLANLMLARASAREREIAVRLALGASRARLLRQLLVESALLALVGAGIGFALARVLSGLLVSSLSTENQAVHLPIATDWRALLFAAGAAAATCVLFGIVPALRATRTHPEAALGTRGMTMGRERFSAQRLMVVAQIAISLVLVVGALLFVRSFQNLMTFDPGMREEGITLAFMWFDPKQVPSDRHQPLKREMLDDVRSLPGVLSAATTTNVPLLGSAWGHGIDTESKSGGGSMFTWVSPGYFQTMGIPLLKGRDFDENDTEGSPRVAVVNQAFVRDLLRGADPLGKTLRTHPEPDYPSTVYEIVGVVPDSRYSDIRGDMPAQAFAPALQFPAKATWLATVIRSDAPPASMIEGVRRRLAERHPAVQVEFGVLQQRIHDGLLRERLMAMLSGFFGVLAGLLAMVGLYGVISYLVARRRNEIGIRMALGADRWRVVGMVMREAGRLMALGLAIGTALSLIAGRSAGALLFGLKPHDPVTLVTACMALALIAAFASFVPARRAARLEPMAALRHE